MLSDIALAFRILAKNPASAAAMILALALGIGANSAIFSVLNAVLLQPLAYPDSERLVKVWLTREGRGDQKGSFSIPDYLDLRQQSTSFDGLAAFNEAAVTRTDGSEPEHLAAAVASPDLFRTLGVSMAVGRSFVPEEEHQGSDRVVVISDAYWRRAFGGSSDVLGKTVALDGVQRSIVGVLPAGLQTPMMSEEPDMWLPFAYGPDDLQRGAHYLGVVGRLKPGMDVASARSDVGTIAAHLAELYPETNSGNGFGLGSLYEDVVGDVRPLLLVMLGAVALVLLIACANVANLLLARSAGRSREVAVRAALGASRGRIVRQFLVESVVIAVTGGALGLGLAWWGVEALVAMSGDALPRTTPIGIDLRVVGFTALLAMASGVLFGLVPAFQASSVDPQEALVTGGRTSTGGRGFARSTFVVAQVALSLVLLIGSGLLLRSLVALKQVNPGFDASNVVTMRISLPNGTYPEPEQQAAFVADVVRRARGITGVTNAAAVFPLAYTDSNMVLSYRPGGSAVPTRSADRTSAAWKPITADYFNTLKIPVLRGRSITDRDDAHASPVLVINQAMATKAFGDDDPIGKRLTIGYNDMTLEVVGVVGDIRSSSLRKAPVPEMYSSFAQTPLDSFNLVIRSDANAAAVTSLVRDQVAAVDRAVPVYDIATMDTRIAGSLEQQRFSTLLVGLFACVALLLSSVGIYAVLAYTVERRRREIGVRMALGAEQRDVLRLVVGGGMFLTVIGIAVGVLGAFGVTRVLDSMLFGITPTDPASFAITAAGLALVALAACYIPARRASRIDPAIALRSE